MHVNFTANVISAKYKLNYIVTLTWRMSKQMIMIYIHASVTTNLMCIFAGDFITPPGRRVSLSVSSTCGVQYWCLQVLPE